MLKCNETRYESHVESIITNSRLEESYLFILHKNNLINSLDIYRRYLVYMIFSEHIYHPIQFLPNRFQQIPALTNIILVSFLTLLIYGRKTMSFPNHVPSRWPLSLQAKINSFSNKLLCSNSLQNFKFRSLYKKETNNEQQKELKEKDQHWELNLTIQLVNLYFVILNEAIWYMC